MFWVGFLIRLLYITIIHTYRIRPQEDHLQFGWEMGRIARALAMAPQVMFFDEATSALDPEMVKGALALIADLGAGGMTMVVVTHEMRFARSASDAVVFMDQGKVVECGPPEQIFEAAKTDRLQRFLSQVL